MNVMLFDSDHFLSLNDDRLIEYAEPFVNEHQDKIPRSVYKTLSDKLKLKQLDNVHTVYALEICSGISPQEFISQAIEHLSHPDPSVCSTACRVIEALPPELLADSLVDKIAATPIVDLYTSHVRTGEQFKMGTNEPFIHAIIEKFRGKTEGEDAAH